MNKTAFLTLALAAAPLSTHSQTAKTIEIHAKRFAFVPAEITIKQGQSVQLELISDDVIHSLRIDALHVNVRMPVNEKVETTITAGQTGNFTGRCGVYCGNRHGEMLFTVHVIP